MHYITYITHMDGQTRQRDPGGCVDEIPRQGEHFAWEFGGWSFPEVGFV